MTLPAHASILTGRTPRTHGIHVNGSSRLDDGVSTLADRAEAVRLPDGRLRRRLRARRAFRAQSRVRRVRRPLSARGGRRDIQCRRPPRRGGRQGGGRLDSSSCRQRRVSRQPHGSHGCTCSIRIRRTTRRRSTARDARRTMARSPTPTRCSDNCSTVSAAPARSTARSIVVTADHGESLGEHGETTHGLFAYESTLAVPLIVSGAAVGRGVVDAPVAHADILPTILDLLAVAPPPDLDGRSAVGLPAADRPVYFEALEANLTRGWAPLTGVVSGDWKYIDLPLPELYNLRADPGEAHNLVEREPARRDTLRRALAQARGGTARDGRAGGRGRRRRRTAAVAWLHGSLRRARAATVQRDRRSQTAGGAQRGIQYGAGGVQCRAGRRGAVPVPGAAEGASGLRHGAHERGDRADDDDARG